MRLLRLFGLLAAFGVMINFCGAMKAPQQRQASSGRAAALTDSDKTIQKTLEKMVQKGDATTEIAEELKKGNPSLVEVARRVNLYASNDSDKRSALDLAAETLNFDVLKLFLTSEIDVFQKELAFDRAASQEVLDARKDGQNLILRLLLNSGVDGNSAQWRAKLAQKPMVAARIQSAIDDNGICQKIHAIALAGTGVDYDGLMKGADQKEQLRRLRIYDTKSEVNAIDRAAVCGNKAFLEKIIGILEQDDKNWALKQCAHKMPGQGTDEAKQCATIKFLVDNKANCLEAITYHLSGNRVYAVKRILAFHPYSLSEGLGLEKTADWIARAEQEIIKKGIAANVHADPGYDNFLKALGNTTENKVGVLSYVPEYGVDAIKKIVAPDARICCMGDIHASLGALFRNLKKLQSKEIDFLDDNFKIKDPKNLMIFTGDYVSRGKHNVGVIYTLLLLVAANPGRVVLLRGNHEISTISNWAKYGITNQVDGGAPCELEDLYGDKNRGVWAQIDLNFFQKLPYVCFLGIPDPAKKIEWLQCCHGGVEPVFDHASFLNDKDKVALSNMFSELNYNNPNTKIAGLETEWPRLLETYILHRRTEKQDAFLANNALAKSEDSGFIWSDFKDALASGKYQKPDKFYGGLAIPSADAAQCAQALGIVGWIRGHQHDNFGLKIGGEAQWRTKLSGNKPTQIGKVEDALWSFKFSQAQYPVFTLSTASESDGLVEPYDSFIILEPNSQGHAQWAITVYEKIIKDKTPFWDPLKKVAEIKQPAEIELPQLSFPDPVTPASAEDEKRRLAVRGIARDPSKVTSFDAFVSDIKGSDQERKREILRRLRLADPNEAVSALESAGSRANLDFIKKVWPYLEEGDKNWVLIQSVKRDAVGADACNAMINFLVRDFPADREKGAKGANLDAVIAYYQKKSKEGEAVQGQIARLEAAKERLAAQKKAEDQKPAEVRIPAPATSGGQASGPTTPVAPAPAPK